MDKNSLRWLDEDENSPGITIKVHDDAYHLIRRNRSMVQFAVEFAKSTMQLTTEEDGSSVATVVAKKIKVGHMVTLDIKPDASKLVIVIALPSCKWTSSHFVPETEVPAAWELPLRQLANACEGAGTRYGYIQTDQELVVCRFALDDEDDDQKWRADIMPVLMSRRGRNVLTSDLALWWLCMLSLSQMEDFKLTTPDETQGIDQWEQVDSGTDYLWWRHAYSGREDAQQSDATVGY